MTTLPFENEPKVAAWRNNLVANHIEIRDIKPLSLLTKRNGELLFALLDVTATTPDGDTLLPYVMVRGDASIVVPLLRNRDTGEEKFLMIRQRRIAHGDWSLEFPAGMLDRQIGDPAGVALAEIEEETGVKVDRSQLFELWPQKLYTSSGLQDEAVLYYGCKITISDTEWCTIEGRIAGKASEGEVIKVTLMNRKEAEAEATSAQVLLGFHLFEIALIKK